MAEEDLIFRLEGVDGGPASRAGDSDTDSDDDEEGYFICSITDDPGAHQNGNFKVNNCHKKRALRLQRVPSWLLPFQGEWSLVPPSPPQVSPSSPAVRNGELGLLAEVVSRLLPVL